jgi:GxxExxY protein
MVNSKLTERIIGCAYTVSDSLGIGFAEKVYENGFAHEIGNRIEKSYI